MSLQKLSQLAVLSEGADLWILADAEKCAWTPKVDWLLNFQMARAKAHESLDLPEPLVDIIEENEMGWKALKASEDWPLLISTQGRLPNQQVIELPYHGDKSEWLKKAHQMWQNLKQPKVRLFLPDDMSEQAANDLWPEQGPSSQVSLVVAKTQNQS